MSKQLRSKIIKNDNSAKYNKIVGVQKYVELMMKELKDNPEAIVNVQTLRIWKSIQE